MAELIPQSLGQLLGRLRGEWLRRQMLFDLPAAQWWSGSDRDLSVQFQGHRAATPVGPAAGPHSQLAQNLAMAWLGGARVMELKTVQINDKLVIPRPCIDVQNVGFNVEWSQELSLEQSALEYAKGWLLVHALGAWNPLNLKSHEKDTIFDLSVGYSLDGVRQPRVARWIDSLRDARTLLAQARAQVPSELEEMVDIDVPTSVADSLTLSTFHGCPADEIERIAEHLLTHHHLHVVLKLNPTLLGYDRVDHLLHDVMGYDEIRIRREDFDHDLGWNDALSMIGRLRTVADRAGRTLGVKVSNTLVVQNHKQFFPASEKVMYLSGQPLHVLSTLLGQEVAKATQGLVPISFSAGIDAQNFAEAVACGFVPITVCTDLLRVGGYGRLPKYLTRLSKEMAALQCTDIASFVHARAARLGPTADARPDWQINLDDYAPKACADPRYASAKNASIPRRLDKSLRFFDCVDCGKCIPVCPNNANFSLQVEPLTLPGTVIEVDASGQAHQRVGPTVKIGVARQFANFADSCNECGNCDVFCPEVGGPYKVKPRFFGSEATLAASPELDGIVVLSPTKAIGRMQGVQYQLQQSGAQFWIEDKSLAVLFDPKLGQVLEIRVLPEAQPGHQLPLWRALALQVLVEKVAHCAGNSVVSGPLQSLD